MRHAQLSIAPPAGGFTFAARNTGSLDGTMPITLARSAGGGRMKQFVLGAGLTAAAAAGGIWLLLPVAAPVAGDSGALAIGQKVYAANCASCHGANLEGQPNWREPLPNGRFPAPPHDASGHTWHHPDAQLLAIIRQGTSKIVGNAYQSDMPGFADSLSEAEMRAVLDYIKSTWPERAAQHQRQVSGN